MKLEKIVMNKGERMLRLGLGQHPDGFFIRVDFWWAGLRLKFKKAEENKEENKEETSVYCPVCESCGEDGCCSAINCDPRNEKCMYGGSYLNDLKTSHRLVSLIDKHMEVNNIMLYKDWDHMLDKVFELAETKVPDNDEIPVMHVEEVKIIYERLKELNSVSMMDLVVVEDKKEVEIPVHIRTEFKFLGLHNTDFILSELYKGFYIEQDNEKDNKTKS